MRPTNFLHQELKRYAKRNKLKMSEVAKEVGVSLQYLSLLWRNEKPVPRRFIKKFAEMFEMERETVGYACGWVPYEFIRICKANPELVQEALDRLLRDEGYRYEGSKAVGKPHTKMKVLSS